MLLYKAGSHCKKSEILIEEDGSPRLFSYLNEKTHILKRCAKGLKTFVDSGAYSAHTKGAIIDVDKYIEFVNEHDENIEVFAQLDTIPGKWGHPKTAEQKREAPIKSWENYLYMRERVKSPDKLLPIFHQGEDFKHLVDMLEYLPHIPYIGISSNKELSSKDAEAWFELVFSTIRASSNPNVKTHAFGMTILRVLKLYPFYSCDSTSWIMCAANGSIMTDTGTISVSERIKSDANNVANAGELLSSTLKAYVESKGYTLDSLATDYKARACWNVQFLTEWMANYKYEPRTTKQNKLF